MLQKFLSGLAGTCFRRPRLTRSRRRTRRGARLPRWRPASQTVGIPPGDPAVGAVVADVAVGDGGAAGGLRGAGSACC